MTRAIRWLLAGGVGALLGWCVFPVLVGLSAAMTGAVLEETSSPLRGHRQAFWAALLVALGLVGGGLGRVARTFRERRSPEKLPSPRPWASWIFRFLAGGLLLLSLCWGLRGATWLPPGWLPAAALFAAWLVVWAGSVSCAAVALGIGAAVGGRESRGQRQAAALALMGALSVLALPRVRDLAFAELGPYDETVEFARVASSGPGLLVGVPLLAERFSGLSVGADSRGAGTLCAEAFLHPDGRLRKTYVTNRRRAVRRAGWHLDVDQLLLDAVVSTCLVKRDNPASYFTKVVSNGIFQGNSHPGNDTCGLDPELPEFPIDIVIRAQTARCWTLLQAAACSNSETVVAILHLRAAGENFPEIASALDMGESAAKMRLRRFLDDLPTEIREQCQ